MSDTFTGTPGPDIYDGGNGDDFIEGFGGSDTLSGGNGDDIIFGGGGADTISGDNGDDVLRGNRGADTIDGGRGADFLNGGRQNDILTGGDGADTFVFIVEYDPLFDGPVENYVFGDDQITDFRIGEDLIDLSFYADQFGLAYNDLNIAQAGADTVIATGYGSIVLTGVLASTLSAGDFVF